jgi:ribulose-phosphate 3-epimerase
VNHGILIAPSVLSADFGRLAEEVAAAEEAGADWIHVDVMDGHFVPNITMGPDITAAIRKATSLPVDVHLMIEAPERYVEAFADAGADRITVHQEVCPHLHRVLEQIRISGALPGVALNPATPVGTLVEAVEWVELVLLMTVNPGFGGQRFIGASVEKLRRLAALLAHSGRQGDVRVQVDGGIDPSTAPGVVLAGADVLVAGSALYGAEEGLARAVERLREAAQGAGSKQA